MCLETGFEGIKGLENDADKSGGKSAGEEIDD